MKCQQLLVLVLCMRFPDVISMFISQGCNGDCYGHGKCSAFLCWNCTCNVGYSGTCCQTDIQECASNPCQFGGSCIDHVNGYSCSCTNGYTGTHCEVETNVCASNPCRNGGTCINYPTHYMCECDTGYSGNNCEIGSDIKDVPRIILETTKNIREGTDIVKVPCFAEGIPTPTIKWSLTHNNFPSNVKQLAHYLVIEHSTIEDSGYYMCTASNSAGMDSKTVHIMVKASSIVGG